MVRRTPTGTTTFTEFIALIPEDQKADLLEGLIHLARFNDSSFARAGPLPHRRGSDQAGTPRLAGRRARCAYDD